MNDAHFIPCATSVRRWRDSNSERGLQRRRGEEMIVYVVSGSSIFSCTISVSLTFGASACQ
ncbi:hypothetical protein K504DRAFT_460929 [Pleomassaria siparia CBS 279.74]|uniref:Uncharacterized protein n=1 Tax=Pleomassaria siparia CBS 279.74 TaxID=1314801 RepID=A0A6G1JVS8_9PLEO|nr:hypothetical protein K504DRAFT_460929 [Pleomassaria siparia CBS 279.74]